MVYLRTSGLICGWFSFFGSFRACRAVALAKADQFVCIRGCCLITLGRAVKSVDLKIGF